METIPQQAQWEQWAKAHHELKQKLLEKRKRLRQLLATAEQQQRAAERQKKARLAAALGVQARMLNLMLAQIEPFNLDTNVFTPPTQALTPAYQFSDAAITLCMVELEALQLDGIQEILRADLELALAGAPVADGLPEAWAAVRQAVARDPEAAMRLQRFRDEFPAYREAVGQAVAGFPDAQPGKERAALDAIKELQLPQLRGEGYKLTALLRQVAGGEALLEALRVVDMPIAASGPLPTGTGPIRPAAKPAASKGPITKRLQERLLDVLKPKQ